MIPLFALYKWLLRRQCFVQSFLLPIAPMYASMCFILWCEVLPEVIAALLGNAYTWIKLGNLPMACIRCQTGVLEN